MKQMKTNELKDEADHTSTRKCLACHKDILRSIYWDYHKNCAKILKINPPLKRFSLPTGNSTANSTPTPFKTAGDVVVGKPVNTSNTTITTNDDFVPTTNGYIPRKIANKKDIEILKIAYDKKINTLLIGETGTGKTHAIRHLCFENKLPYMRVNLNEATTVEDLVGQWIPDKNGGFKWEDGVLTRFMRLGGVFVCDEINAANSGVLFVLHSVLDDERKIVLVQKDGEVVHASPDFWFISTMNPDYEGTKPLNSALKDRFGLILNYDYDDKVEKKLIPNEKLLVLAGRLRNMFKKGEILTPVSTRTLIQFCHNQEYFGDDLAVEIFLNKFSREEARAIQSVIELTLQGKANPLLDDADEQAGESQ